MTSQLLIKLDGYQSDTVIFEMFIMASPESEFTVHSRRTDWSEDGVDFSFKTSKLEMIEYYVKSVFSDYDPAECTWSFDVYSACLDNTYVNFQAIDDLIMKIDPIIDYDIDINSLKTHITNCVKFMQSIEIINQDDLPDLIPLSLEEIAALQEDEEHDPNPELALDQIYDDAADDIVFIAN
jgi:hypothetical protein